MGGMRRAGAIALTAVLSLGLVACGGGSDDTAADPTTTTAEDPNTESTDVDLSDFTGECADFVSAFAGASASIGAAFSGAPGADLEAAADYFTDVSDKLPKEIRADFAIFAEAYTSFAQAITDADIDFSDPSTMDPEKLAALEGLSESFSAPEVEEATANIQAYMDANCKG